ncbi:MAG: class I tRNA ligase family protein, partial [Clostridia bacterium]|nr:class I tRNA ligase family protein [Clostridia bacterium]
PKSKEAAYTTLYTVLATLSKIIAPFVPFMAENIYQNLVRNFDKNAPESVHLCAFPTADEKMINPVLEKGMEHVRELVVLGRAARNKSNLKNRQPLGRLLYNGRYDLPSDLVELVKDELNVKSVEQSGDDDSFVSYEIKPQLKTLGPKYGALLGKIRALLQERPQDIIEAIKRRKAIDELKEEYRAENDVKSEFTCEIDGTKIVLSEEDLLITVKNKEGFSSESDGDTTVVLDTALTEELIREGIEREIVSKVQNMRKEAGFEVTDHILIGYAAEGLAKSVLDDAKFLSDVLCDGIVASTDGFTKECDINGHKVTITVKKVED